MARADRLNKNKQAIRMAKNRGTKRTGNYVNAQYETIELTPEQKTFVDCKKKKTISPIHGQKNHGQA